MNYEPEVNILSYGHPAAGEGRVSAVLSPTGGGVPLMTILATRPRLAQRRPSEDLTAIRRYALMRQMAGQALPHAASLDTAGT